MSKRQPVKRKKIIAESTTFEPETPKQMGKNSDSVYLEITPISEPEIKNIVETQKKESESLNISETSDPMYEYTANLSKNKLCPTEYQRKATKSSIDDESIASIRKPSIMGSIKSSRATLRDYGTRRRNSTVERNGNLSRLHLERMTYERKIETDEVFKLKNQLKNKENEIERLKYELQAVHSGKIVKKCTVDDYKTAFLMNQELLKYAGSSDKLEGFEILDQLNHLFIDNKKDDFPEILIEEYNKIIANLYDTFKKTIYKNLILNAQLKELGLCLPETLIEEMDFKKFVELHETLKTADLKRDKLSEVNPNTLDIEAKLKEQIDAIDCQKWEREAVAKDIETAYHDKFLNIIDFLIDKKKNEITIEDQESNISLPSERAYNISDSTSKEDGEGLIEPPPSPKLSPQTLPDAELVSIASRFQLAVDDSKISLEKAEVGPFEPLRLDLDLDFDNITF